MRADNTRALLQEPALLIRINQLYHPGMSPAELYDTTGGVWVLGERRVHARFGIAVYKGVVLEVFEIGAWHPAGTTSYESRVIDTERDGNRWEFTGRVADDDIRARLNGTSVEDYFMTRLFSLAVCTSPRIRFSPVVVTPRASTS